MSQKWNGRIFLVLVAILLLGVLALGGCNTATPSDNGKVPQDSGTKDNMPSGDYDVLKWPDWVPKSIPPYKYGDLYHVDRFEEKHAVLYLTSIDLTKDPFNAYVEELIKAGWEEEEGWTGPEDKDHFIIHMTHEKDNLFLSYDYMVEKDETHGRIRYSIDNTSGKAGNGETGDGKFTSEFEGPDGVTGVFGNEKMPEGYPHAFCPVYPESDLLQAQEIKAGKETTYAIALLSKDNAEKVFDFYSENPNVSMTVSGFAVGLTSNDGKMTAQIQVSETEKEHRDQGYQTFVVKILIVTE